MATLSAHFAPTPGAMHLHLPGSSGMGEIVNLRRERKKAARQLAERTASANRLLHGRSKTTRDLETARDAKARRELDLHRVETGDEP